MRANEFITEQPVTTTNAQGVTTTVDKKAGTVTTSDDSGTTVKDRSGNIRSMTTPKIGGFQAKQTFRPDATPGYQQATYQQGPTTLSVKGSPETGFTKSAKFSAGGMDVKQTQRYSGQKQTDASYNIGGTTVGASQITDPRTGRTATTQTTTTAPSPTKRIQTTATKTADGRTVTSTKARLTQSQFEDVQAAIREHVAKNVPFTECMFRPGSAAFTEFYRQVRECADKLNLDWEDQELISTDIGECIMVEGEMVALDVPMIEDIENIDFANMSKIQNASTVGELVSALKPYENEIADDMSNFVRKKGMGEVQQRKAMHMLNKLIYWASNSDAPISIKTLKKIPEIGTASVNILADYLDTEFGFNLQGISEAEYQGRKVELNKPKRGGSKKFYVYTKNKKGNVIKVSWGDTTGLSVKAKDRGAVKSFVARHKCKEKNDKTKAGYWACRTPRYKSLGVKGGQWW
jgi:hypothetical protein